MNKELLSLLMTNPLLSSKETYDAFDYYYENMARIKNHKPKKTYKNKNANIEYYVDEKGNIRKRKVGELL